MKNTKKLFGIIAIAVIIGLLFAGCGDGGGDDSGNQMLPQGNLPAPTGVKAVALSASSIEVSWELVQGAMMYNIYLYFSSNASNNDYKDKDYTIFPSTKSIKFNGLSGGEKYYFRVAAFDSSGEGRFSSTVSATTESGPLAKPTGLKATAQSKTEIQLSWDPVLGADGYNIEQSTNTNFSSPTKYTTTSDKYKVSELSAGTRYYFRVRAYDKDDESRLSEYSSTNTETWYEVPQTATSLTEGIWADGSISAGGDAWYSFNVTNDTTYYVWWDDKDNSTNTLDAKSSAYYGNGSVIFNDVDAGYTPYRSFKASSNAVVFVKVFPSSLTGAGTFGIAYSTINTRPKAGFIPEDVAPLTAGKWTNGEITESAGETWYKFTATAATNYLWWNDSNSGDKTKTLDVNVSVFKSDETPITTNNDSAWSYGRSVQSLTVGEEYYVCVTPKTSGGTGSFAIAFNNDYYTRPLLVPASPKSLTAGTWADDEISTQGGENYYSFNAAAGTPYYLWWNEIGTTNGNGLKTLNVDVSVFSGDGDILLSNNTGNGWANSQTITPAKGGTIYIRLKANSAYNTGTYGIVYATTNKRPAIPAPDFVQVTEGVWANGEIAKAGGEQWFKFKATKATQFIHASFGTVDNSLIVQLYNNDLDAIVKTGSIYSSQKNFICELTAGNDYYIRVTASSSAASGTFKMTFNDSYGNPDIIPLTEGTWAEGDIPVEKGEQWFKFTATTANQYIHINFDTLETAKVQLYNNDGTKIESEAELGYYGYTIKNIKRTVTVGDVYIIKVIPNQQYNKGKYKITFNKSFIAPGYTAGQLTEGSWTDGNIPAAKGEQWFKFTATAGTQYIHVSFSTLYDMNVQLFDSNGAAVGSAANLFSYQTNMNRTVTAGQEYYIRVNPPSSSGSGTYKIAFNISSTAP